MTRCPAFLAAAAFAGGIWLGTVAWRPPLWWMAALLACACGALVITRSARLAFACALLALAALGALNIGARDQSTSRNGADPRLSSYINADGVEITGHVVRDSSSRPRGDSASELVDVETECIAAVTKPVPDVTPKVPPVQMEPLTLSDEGESVYASMRAPQKKPRARRSKESAPPVVGPCVPIVAGIRLTVYPHDTGEDEDDETGKARQFFYGERLRFSGRLREPRNFGNPGAWDYAGYLREAGIQVLGSARADRVESLPGFSGTRLQRWRSSVRRSILAKIDALWPGERGGLVAAMVVGDKSELGRDVRRDFQRTGVYHILVVSGMNVGIIAFVIFWVLRRLRVRDLACSVITVVLSCGYALITDGGAPILRATLMLAIYLGARLLYRDRAPLNAVALAALALLVADPRALFDASFQLTFVSVAAIAGIAVPLLERTAQPYRRALSQLDALAYDLTLPPRLAQFRLDLRLLESKSARLIGRRLARFVLTGGIGGGLWMFELIVVSAIAQFALALPMAVYFHRAVLVGLPANLIVVPLTGVLMPAATAAVALSYLSPLLAKPAAWITALSLDAITGTIRVVGGWRAAEWRIPSPDPLVMAGCILSIAFCLFALRRTRWVAASGILLLALAAASVSVISSRREAHAGLEFTAIDAGQADSTLIVTPDGHTLLVDAAGSFGPFQSEFDFGEDVVSPYLWSRGISTLDAVAITHAHSDHMGGMRSVITNFRPRELWIGPNARVAALEELLQQARNTSVNLMERRAGGEFEFGGAYFRVLSPPPDWQTEEKVRNQDSMVLQVRYGATSGLITGDADEKMERRMLEGQPRATVLHVAHNGSATSTSREFLETLQPRFAVISVGARNQFHHPRREVLARLAGQGIATFRTDLHGAASFFLDGKTVTPFLPARQR